MEAFTQVLTKIDDLVWGVPLMVLIMCGGLLLTLRMGFLQIRKLPLALKWMIRNEEGGKGEVTRFVPHCPRRSEPVILSVWLLQSVPAAPEPCSGWS